MVDVTVYEAVDKQQLKHLLQEIETGLTKLPDFQRSFVWDPNDTVSLVESITRNFPAGSILRVRDSGAMFATRHFEGAPQLKVNHNFLVLDGQQRLTSLYQAFYGVGEFRYFIDLESIRNGAGVEDGESIYFLKASKKGVEKMVNDIAIHAEKKIMPLSVVSNRNGGVGRWIREFLRMLPESERDSYEQFFDNFERTLIQNIDDYVFPVVTLSESASVESLCTIFETLNKTGVKLTVFELLTARFWNNKINLRSLWEKAVEKYPSFTDYGVPPYVMLQAISLVKGDVARCKKSDILSLTHDDIINLWDKAAKNLDLGLQILRDDCKIMGEKWLPTSGMLGPLAAILVISDGLPRGSRGVRRTQVCRWLWCAIFGQRYEAAANTRGEKDVNDLRGWFSDPLLVPEVVADFRFDREILKETHVRSSGIYKGVICLTLSSGAGARDFHSGSLITQSMVTTGEVDDHHIFPKNFLESVLGIDDKSLINCVVNRTLIDRQTNQEISNKAPSDYLENMIQNPDFDAILRSHLIPSGPKNPMSKNDYSKFLEDRADLIINEINRVTK